MNTQIKSCAMAALLLVVSFVMAGQAVHAQDIILRVDIENGTTTDDGSAWGEDAIKFLQDALVKAAEELDNPQIDSVDIWVAEGVYRPDQRADICGTQDEDCLPCGDCAVGATFAIPSNVRIFGGFNGSENHPGERDHDPSLTILSGDLAGDGSQRSHDIVTFDDTDESARLDTVTVEGAGENGLRLLNSDAIVSNCIIRQNTLGALMQATTTGDDHVTIYNQAGELVLEFDNYGENSYAVVRAKGGINETATIDGFTIRTTIGSAFIAIDARPRVLGCTFISATSAAVHLRGESFIVFDRCQFQSPARGAIRADESATVHCAVE